jgi:hypothetical protein
VRVYAKHNVRQRQNNLTTLFNFNEREIIRTIVYRKDRSETTSEAERGGGVLIAVNNRLHSSVPPVTNLINIEHIFVRIKLYNMNYIIGSVYFPPRTAQDFNNIIRY